MICTCIIKLLVYGTKGSVLWTLGLAVYLYYRIVSRDGNVTKWVLRVLYVVCYTLPLYASLWLLLTDHLGYPREGHSSGGWCAIIVGTDTTRTEKEQCDETLMIFMTVDIWVILTFVTMIPIYLIVHCYVRKELQECKKELLLTTHQRQTTSLRADYKFLLVPVVFMVLRVWDILDGVIFLNSNSSEDHTWLKYLNAIGDSAQGFFNFILFCVFQKKVREYTIYVICRCMGCLKVKPSVKDDIDHSFTPSQMSNFSSDPPDD
ncbi:G-protein coupled receptor 157-like isoform X2 [Dysidea avara]|uniref:G-protein coupled receptor 157-like isoform X2 n=1 Tax=Dysidea avara TaxID=196820 RepID=UPI0033342057